MEKPGKTVNKVSTIRGELLPQGVIGVILVVIIRVLRFFFGRAYDGSVIRQNQHDSSKFGISNVRYDIMDVDGWVEGLMRRVKDGVMDAAVPGDEVATGTQGVEGNVATHIKQIDDAVLTATQKADKETLKVAWNEYWQVSTDLFATLQTVNPQSVAAISELVRGPLADAYGKANDTASKLNKSITKDTDEYAIYL